MANEELAVWHARYHGVLFQAAIAITREAADAEEVVSDAFTKAWTDAAGFDSTRGSVLGWLTMMTRSRALDLVRSRARRQRAYDRAEVHYAASDDAWRVAGSDERDPTELADLHRTLTRALGTLPYEQRQAIELAFIHDTPHSSVARHLGVPLGTVKTRVRLGLRKMRSALATR
jgi:RNA polymerase sigma-70 factor, ECF subfamily